MTAHNADAIIEAMARAIYGAAYEGKREDKHGNRHPEPGWCWDRCGDVQRDFCLQQARAAYAECLRMLREPRPAHTYASENAGLYLSQERYWRAEIDARLKELE